MITSKLFINALFLIALCSDLHADPVTVTLLNRSELQYDLPLPILNRMRLSELSEPEFRKSLKEVGLSEDETDAAGTQGQSTEVYQANDGLIFCVDHLHMSLWIRKQNIWECFLNGIRVNKTMGGQPSRLPLRYMGNGWFAFSQTAPHDTEEKSTDRFPTAYAITYLLDSKTGKITDRGEAFIYEHNPPVEIPAEWYQRTGTTRSSEK